MQYSRVGTARVVTGGLVLGLVAIATTGRGQQAKVPAAFFSPLPPVGAILAYAGDANVPPGWTLCDGKRLDAKGGFSRDQVAAAWWEHNVPDLNGRILRGTTEANEAGKVGGSESVPAHATAADGGHIHHVPDHAHGLGNIQTGPISARGGAINGVPYLIKDDGAGWKMNAGDNPHHIDVSGGSNDEGQHRHELEGGTGQAGVLTTPEREGTHVHSIGAIPFSPSHVVVRYIIRIQ